MLLSHSMNRIKEYRKKSGRTLQQVAEALGVSIATVSRIERDATSPTLKQLSALSGLFSVPIVIVRRTNTSGEVEGTVKEVRIDADGRRWLVARSTEPEFQAPIRLDDGSQGDAEVIAVVIGSYRPE